jgi:chaperonin GroEL
MVFRPDVDDSLCFVAMPFQDPFNGYFKHVLAPTLESLGLKPLRADNIYGTGPIITDIWVSLWRARLVIADVTDKNPNVNYELGLCDAIGVPTILITKRLADVPFDYRHRRCIVYDTDQATWREDLIDRLKNTIEAVLRTASPDPNLQWPYEARPPETRATSGLLIERPRDSFLSASATMADIVSTAYGPLGLAVTVRSDSGASVPATRGDEIASGTHSSNPIEESAFERLRLVADGVRRDVGDYTKTALLIANGVLQYGDEALRAGYDRIAVLEGMTSAATIAVESLGKQAQPISGDDVRQLAYTASQSYGIADAIRMALRGVGKDGVIHVESRSASGVEVTFREGMQFKRGYLSPKFATNPDSNECSLTNCRVLVSERPLRRIPEVIPLLERIAAARDPILLVAHQFEDDVASLLALNAAKDRLRCAAVRVPTQEAMILGDIAVMCGARMMSADSESDFSKVTLDDLGRADRVVVTPETTTIYGGHGVQAAIEARVKVIRDEIDRADDYHMQVQLQERLARLAGGIGVIAVGGAALPETNTLLYRTAAALHTTYTAVEEQEK